MGWKGAIAGGIVGSLVGSMFRVRPLGVIAGALAGHFIEREQKLREARKAYRKQQESCSPPCGTLPGELDAAYTILGCYPSADDEEVKNAYRERVRKFHPDALRAGGFTDRQINDANNQMVLVNEAWAKIKAARGF